MENGDIIPGTRGPSPAALTRTAAGLPRSLRRGQGTGLREYQTGNVLFRVSVSGVLDIYIYICVCVCVYFCMHESMNICTTVRVSVRLIKSS